MNRHQADAAEQIAWRTTGERPPCPQRYLLGAAVRGTVDRAGIRLILIARPMDGTIFVDALVAPVRAPWVRCARLGARGLAAHDP